MKKQMELADKPTLVVGSVVPAQGGNTPADLLRMAVAGGADVDKLAKLMDLQERWQAAEAKRQFVEAMADFQSRMPAIPKVREVHRSAEKGGGLMYRFANADDITRAIRANEKDCGFSHRFEFEPREGGGCKTTCIITHKGGHSERTTVSIPATKGMNTNAAQDNGIEMQYGMRYSLIGAYGITTGAEDTDGRTGDEPARVVTPKQAEDLRFLIGETGTDLTKFLKWAQAVDLASFPADLYAEAMATLNARLDRKNAGAK